MPSEHTDRLSSSRAPPLPFELPPHCARACVLQFLNALFHHRALACFFSLVSCRSDVCRSVAFQCSHQRCTPWSALPVIAVPKEARTWSHRACDHYMQFRSVSSSFYSGASKIQEQGHSNTRSIFSSFLFWTSAGGSSGRAISMKKHSVQRKVFASKNTTSSDRLYWVSNTDDSFLNWSRYGVPLPVLNQTISTGDHLHAERSSQCRIYIVDASDVHGGSFNVHSTRWTPQCARLTS